MQSPIIGNKDAIQHKLFQLGFDNLDDILNTAEYLYTTQGSPHSGIRLGHPPVNIKNQSGYIINLNRVGNSEDYQMNHIGFFVNIKNDRSKDGLKRVSRYWHINDGPLPHIERMRWQVDRAAKIESAKESFLSSPAPAQSNSDTINASMGPLDKDLETALNRRGFPHSPQMLQTATYADNLAFLTIREKADEVKFPGFDSLGFFFAVVYPDNETPLQIEYINASLIRNGRQNGNQKFIMEKDYWLAKEDLPTKDRIVRDFLNVYEIIRAKRPNPKLMKTSINERSPGRGLRH